MAEVIFTAILDFFKHFVVTDVAEIVILSGVVVLCVWLPLCFILRLGGEKK